MRCKKHLSDLSSGVGVCASCLRERLFAIITAQVRHQQAQERAQPEDRRKFDSHQAPLVFPRSVSPYICRRSNDSTWHHPHPHPQSDQRFYSTPQVGTATTAAAASNKKKQSKFSLFISLFTSRSEKTNPDPRDPKKSTDSLAITSSSPISSSWLPSLLSSRRKKHFRSYSLEEAAARRPCRPRNRGISPAKETEEEEEGSSSASGYPPESSQGKRKPANASPMRRRGQPQHSRNVSGLTLCLSPLVRASPSRQQSIGYSGEIRVTNKPYLTAAASFCANKSRRFTDFGRYNNYNP